MIIRYSMLQAWLTCPAAFYDTYVLNKIDPEKSSSLEFGTALHLGIRTTLEGEDGIAAFQMYWNSLKDVKMKYYQHGWKELNELGEHFLNSFKSRHAKKFTEFEQEVPLEMPFLVGEGKEDYDQWKQSKPHVLQGTADLIGLYEGNLTVVDWKSSSNKYKKSKIELNPQLYIYAKLYQHKTGKLPQQIMYKVFCKKDGSVQTLQKDLTQETLDATVNTVESIARAMLRTVETKELFHGSDCYCEGL